MEKNLLRLKKVTKKNSAVGEGHGLRAELLLQKLIQSGNTGAIKGSALHLERTIGTAACTRLADFLEECLDDDHDGVGGVC